PDSITPDLSYVPKIAMESLENIILKRGAKNLCLIGSSLGGFYATFLAEKYKIKTILVNPVVDAYKTLLPAIGKIYITYSGQSFFWGLDLVNSLKEFYVEEINPELYLLLLQKGDKVLDYRIAENKFKGTKCIVQESGSHRFENFASLKDEILEWAKC
ncbi:MAG: YqiA/YcfP family alpha/beta fold hydrolase, partial [Helicobacter sp.]|nr:YqiA/YcfP family alpha/beta fold hydrolase [Helicobacter sp.]